MLKVAYLHSLKGNYDTNFGIDCIFKVKMNLNEIFQNNDFVYLLPNSNASINASMLN